jgi:hypothetical protein
VFGVVLIKATKYAVFEYWVFILQKKKKKKKTTFKLNGSYRVDTMLNGFHGSCWVTREIAVLCGVWSPDLLT